MAVILRAFPAPALSSKRPKQGQQDRPIRGMLRAKIWDRLYVRPRTVAPMFEPPFSLGVRRARAGGCLNGVVSGRGDVSFGVTCRAPLGAFASLVRRVLPTCAVTGGQCQSRAAVFINAKVPRTVSSARRCSPWLHAQLATGTAAGARRCELAVLVAIPAARFAPPSRAPVRSVPVRCSSCPGPLSCGHGLR
jgi:hypothetical protein